MQDFSKTSGLPCKMVSLLSFLLLCLEGRAIDISSVFSSEAVL